MIRRKMGMIEGHCDGSDNWHAKWTLARQSWIVDVARVNSQSDVGRELVVESDHLYFCPRDGLGRAYRICLVSSWFDGDTWDGQSGSSYD